MKNLKKLSCLLLALALAFGVLAVPSMPVQAAAKATVPKKVRIWRGGHNDYGISVKYANSGDQIKHLKSSSKSLVVKWTEHSEATGSQSDSDYYKQASIGLYAKKDGTYIVKFDIYSKDGKTKRSSHKVTVYARSDSPSKSIKFAGKDIPSYTTKKKGKLSVKMSKGYKLNKIEVITYDKNRTYAKSIIRR